MFLLIAISIVFVVAIGVAFWWAIFAGQFDNSDSAASSILNDDEASPDPQQGVEPGETAGGVQGETNHASSSTAHEASQAKMPR
ncbi:cbb3-type cytochrome oxidase assembly protein CcoS [Pusillimonas sp.]|uniref:cbb3-type cytochrome oxidase assembly protein CcoS n=1 Tax=Pusillimonas sp. TaxID=3040095 RepID=UPI002D800FE1|nr:cbb3-type cytochrome oxidase assembly protein CcoS [Pusillimonas sp.]